MSGGCDEGSFWPRFGQGVEVNVSQETNNNDTEVPNAQPEKTDSDDDHDGRVERHSSNSKNGKPKKSDFSGRKSSSSVVKDHEKKKEGTVMKRPSTVKDEKKKAEVMKRPSSSSSVVKEKKNEEGKVMKRPSSSVVKEEKNEGKVMKRPSSSVVKEEKNEGKVMKRPSMVKEEKKKIDKKKGEDMKKSHEKNAAKKDDEKNAVKKDDEMGGEGGEEEQATNDDEVSLGGTTLSLPGLGEDGEEEDPGYSHGDFLEVDEDLRESSEEPKEPEAPAEAPKLGCSKCRYSKRGCARCRGR